MKFKLISQKIIPLALALCTGIVVAASPVTTNPKDYTVTAMETETTDVAGNTENKIEKTTKKNTIEIATTEELPEAAANTVSEQASKNVGKVSENQTYKDGTYTGSGQGYRGTIKVKVTIKNGKISKIDVVSSSDDADFFNRAKALLSKIIKGQTTNVDTVSGATYSSAGLIRAVRNALSKAATSSSKKSDKDNKETPTTESTRPTTKQKPETKPVDESNATYKDGSYYGEGEGFGGTVKVKVVISKGKIASVTVESHEDGQSYMEQAMSLLSKIVKGQTTNLDAVSGATYSSAGIIEATRNALEKAKIKKETTEEKTTEDKKDTDQSGETDNNSDNQDDVADNTEDKDNTESENNTEAVSIYKDGTYDVSVPCEPDEYDDFDTYQLAMSITIESDRIIEITGLTAIPSDSINKSFIKMAEKGLVSKIVSKGTPEGIDAVSGATCSSKSIIDACKEALNKAKN